MVVCAAKHVWFAFSFVAWWIHTVAFEYRDHCWTKELRPPDCCPMNDDTHACFQGPFKHKICCTSPMVVLNNCNCTSFYLQEVATFLQSLHGNNIGQAEMKKWKWKYHPINCTGPLLRTALHFASKMDDQCTRLERLHYMILCGIQSNWWQTHRPSMTDFWIEIMSLSIQLLTSGTCDGLFSPHEVFKNYQQFQQVFASTTRNNFVWQREFPSELKEKSCDGSTFQRPTVHCAVMGRLPEDGLQMRAIMQTWGSDCDSIQMYLAKVPWRGASSWTDRGSGIPVFNLATKYGVLSKHPDQVGELLQDEDSLQMIKKTNLIRKTLAMWHHVGTSSLASDFVCRLDPDTLFLVDRFRKYIHKHCIRKDSMVYFGQVLNFLKDYVGLFPDGGAGICLPWRATERFANLLKDEVHLFTGGDEAEDVPMGCQMLPGHLDDVVTGQCFQQLDLLPHHALQSPLGQSFFSGQVLPRFSQGGLLVGRFEDWIHFGRLNDLFQCEMNCKTCNCSRQHPEWWVDERMVITLHRYKNSTEMRSAYHYLQSL